jgi:phage protein D
MDFQELRDRYGDFSMPGFSVRVGDQEFRERDGALADLEVDTTLDGATYFSFTFADPRDREAGGAGALAGDGFEAGQTVDISMGYGNRLEPVALGRIHSIQPEFPADGGATVAVSGYGLLHDMMRVTESASWDERTDSDVAEEVASAYDFAEVDVEDTGTTHRKIIQDAESDYRFLKRLADRNGFELFAARDAFRFRAPKYDADPVLTLRYGESLHSFASELSNASQVGTVEVRHWDPKRKAEIVGVAEGDEAQGGKTVLRVPVRSREEAEQVAEATLDRVAAGLLQGTGEIVGVPEISVGETVRIEGLGETFTNNYYTHGVNQRIGQSGYWTAFDVRERAL